MSVPRTMAFDNILILKLLEMNWYPGRPEYQEVSGGLFLVRSNCPQEIKTIIYLLI